MTSPINRQSDYRYVFGQLGGNEPIIAEIDLQGTYMDLEINVGGRFDGTFQLDQTGKRNQDLIDATIPGRCFVIVERNDVPIWGGFVWSRVYQSQSKTCQLYAQHFMAYPNYQFLRTDFLRYLDQQTIFYDLWNHMQLVAGRNINVFTPIALTGSAPAKLVDIKGTDFKTYGEVISSIADATDGFDWVIDINKVGGQYLKTARAGYPTIGSINPDSMVFEYPGSILNYYATESMAEAGTNVFTLGAGEGDTMLVNEAVAQDLLDGGFPRWDVSVSRKDIDSSTHLATVGAQEGLIRRPPKLVVKPTLKADIVPEFGSFGLGDACTVVIKDPRFPSGIRFSARVVKWTLQPQSSENTDEFTLVFAGDTDG